MNVSSPALKYDIGGCQLGQQIPVREQVSKALKAASAAFALQHTQPDGQKYAQICEDFNKFFLLQIPLDDEEQETAVQVLQVACAMHENAITNPMLSSQQRLLHHSAAMDLVFLFQKALDSITHHDLRGEVHSLSVRAEAAFSRAVDALGISWHFELENAQGDVDFWNEIDRATEVPLRVSTPSKSAPSTTSVHGTTVDTPSTVRTATLKQKALAVLGENTSKMGRLGRCHTMPSLSHSSRSATDRKSSWGTQERNE